MNELLGLDKKGIKRTLYRLVGANLPFITSKSGRGNTSLFLSRFSPKPNNIKIQRVISLKRTRKIIGGKGGTFFINKMAKDECTFGGIKKKKSCALQSHKNYRKHFYESYFRYFSTYSVYKGNKFKKYIFI